MKHRWSALIPLIWCLASSTAAARESPAGVFSLLEQRMLLMKDVAGHKAQQHLPIEDESQEKQVLEAIRRQSVALGLEPAGTRRLYKTLINAGKAIQYRYRAEWLSNPEKEWMPRSLNEQVRPRLAAIDGELLVAIKHFLCRGGTFTTQQQKQDFSQIQIQFLSDADKRNIFQALSEIHPAVNSPTRRS